MMPPRDPNQAPFHLFFRIVSASGHEREVLELEWPIDRLIDELLWPSRGERSWTWASSSLSSGELVVSLRVFVTDRPLRMLHPEALRLLAKRDVGGDPGWNVMPERSLIYRTAAEELGREVTAAIEALREEWSSREAAERELRGVV